VALQVRDKPSGRRTSVADLSDASHLFVARITVQPGVRFPWHTPPGPILIATFLGAPPEGPLTLPVDATTAAQLDAKCGLSGAASHSH
jgi:hypothetical protein